MCESIHVRSLTGRSLVTVTYPPEDAQALKAIIESVCGIPHELQQLFAANSTTPLNDDNIASTKRPDFLTLVVDEWPLYCWRLMALDSVRVSVEGSSVRCNSLRDFGQGVPVWTKAPVVKGTHYFEFHLNQLADVLLCGLLPDPLQNHHYGGRFYSSCQHRRNTFDYAFDALDLGDAFCDARDTWAIARSGDTVGMYVDADDHFVVFALNGRVQGVFKLFVDRVFPYLLLCETGDYVELRKPPLQDAPCALVEALSAAKKAPLRDRNPPALQDMVHVRTLQDDHRQTFSQIPFGRCR